MFDCEKLTVYRKAKSLNIEISIWFRNNAKIDAVTLNRLREYERATIVVYNRQKGGVMNFH